MMAGSVDKGQLVDIVDFDCTQGVSHSTFIATSASCRLGNWEMRWLENCLGHQA